MILAPLQPPHPPSSRPPAAAAAMDTSIDLSDPEKALNLNNIRYQLIRLEDTIIFFLIERAQFPLNRTIYDPDANLIPDFYGSFLDWLLLQQERVHALVRRYQSPDEYPFFPKEIPEPFLQPLSYPKLLHPNKVSVNDRIKKCYIENILPAACRPGPDKGESRENYGSCGTIDVPCLQALSRRIHFGKFVAEAKFRKDVEGYTKMIKEKDVEGLERSITNKEVEKQVLKRLELKAKTYGSELAAEGLTDDAPKIDVQAVVDMYRDWVIPLTKVVEVDYLLQRLDPVPPGYDDDSPPAGVV